MVSMVEIMHSNFANLVLTRPAFIRGELSTDFIPAHILTRQDGEQPVEILHAMASPRPSSIICARTFVRSWSRETGTVFIRFKKD